MNLNKVSINTGKQMEEITDKDKTMHVNHSVKTKCI